MTEVLLAGVIVWSYRRPGQVVWKSSVIPLLFCGLREDEAEPTRSTGGSGDLTQLNRQAKKILVRFHDGPEPGFVRDGAHGEESV